MTAKKLRDLYFSFFEKRGHKQIPNSNLVPENDPSTLFISAGIQPLVPYFLGKKHPVGKRLVNVQQCIRTGDIDEVGDMVHHTFFEMLGNWSLGDYFKKDMIPWSFQFLTQELQLPLDKLAISVFVGDKDSKKDTESAKLWQDQGISSKRVAFLPKVNNWWGPPGITGPCGPDTEMFYWASKNISPINFDPSDPNWVEIWNDVLIQYYKNDQGVYEKLIQNNIDTGMGVERTLAILNGFSDNYLTAIWQPTIKVIEKLSSKSYLDNPIPFRIIADHLRASVFIVNSGVEPSNKEAGYVLRRLIRKAIRQAKYLDINSNFTKFISDAIISNQVNYAGDYPELNQNKHKILEIIDAEETKFRKTLDRGLSEIQRLISKNKTITGLDAFNLYQSFGFPIELIEDELFKNNLKFKRTEFDNALEKHIQKSRTLSAGKFASGLADHSDIITKYHTATHILHVSLRQVLGDHVSQAGSNITGDRLRFDFTHLEKITDDQIKKVENLINSIVDKDLSVLVKNMSYTKAIESGALAFFGSKYPPIVSVYSIKDFSKEVCTGPHVSHTGLIGRIKIIKQESVGSGKRRIYAKIV